MHYCSPEFSLPAAMSPCQDESPSSLECLPPLCLSTRSVHDQGTMPGQGYLPDIPVRPATHFQ